MTGLGVYNQGDEPFGGLNEIQDQKVYGTLRFVFYARAAQIFFNQVMASINLRTNLLTRFILRYGKRWLRRHEDTVAIKPTFIKRRDKGI